MVRSFSWSDYFKKCFHLISKWLRDNVSDDYIQHKLYVASLNFPTKFHTYNYCYLNIRCKIKSNNKQFRGDLISWGMLKLYWVLSQCNYFCHLTMWLVNSLLLCLHFHLLVFILFVEIWKPSWQNSMDLHLMVGSFYRLYAVSIKKNRYTWITNIILLHEKFLQFDWLRAVVFHLNPFAPGDFAEKHVFKLVEWFSGHCCAIKS